MSILPRWLQRAVEVTLCRSGMTASTLASALIVSAGIASPAQAQLANGISGYSSAPTNASEAEYWQMMGRLGQCLADSKEEQSRAFLATHIDSQQEADAFRALFNRRSNRCMGSFVNASMRRAHVRGVVAEGLFEQLPEETRASLVAEAPEAPAAIANLHDFARCYVSAHPANAMTLLRETRLQTQGELDFIRTISGEFAECLPQGRDVQLRPINVRLAFAEALYQAAAQGASSAGQSVTAERSQ